MAVKVEADFGGWTDISAYVFERDRIRIVRGRSDEGSTASPQTCSLTLNNSDGRFSRRNAEGPYYGSLTRNTPLRVSVPRLDDHYLSIPATTSAGQRGNNVSAPDSSGLSITGDIDIRIDAYSASWRMGADLVSKYIAGTNQRSYALIVEDGGTYADGLLGLYWSTDGTSGNEVIAHSTVPIPNPITGRLSIRATLDVNNGSGGYTATFYTADDFSTWTQLGDAVETTSGTTSIYDGTAPVNIGDCATTGGTNSLNDANPELRVYQVSIRDGIGGTERGNPDFTAATDAASTIDDDAGNTWTVNADAVLVGHDYRFYGEVSEWPLVWGKSGRDVYSQIIASGLGRRLNQGRTLGSAYYRGVTNVNSPLTDVIGYWPCEDGSGSDRIGSGLSLGRAAIVTGEVTFANNTDFGCSDSLPTLGAGGVVCLPDASYTDGLTRVTMLCSIPSDGLTDTAQILRCKMQGTAQNWVVQYGTGGTLKVICLDKDASTLESSTPGFSVDGQTFRLGLTMVDNSGDTDWQIDVLYTDGTSDSDSGTLSSYTTDRIRWVRTGPPWAPAANLSFGHIVVQHNGNTDITIGQELLSGYAGVLADHETAAMRIARLCTAEGLSFRCEGITRYGVGSSIVDTGEPALGPQSSNTLPAILQEAETADSGILYELRERLAFGYRARESLYTQAPAVTFDYTGSEIQALDIQDDDQRLINDFVAKRSTGSFSRYADDTSPLGTAEPPDGVGLYSGEATFNVLSDVSLGNLASWTVHLGTVDECRYPRISASLAHPTYANDNTAAGALAALEIGDLVRLTNLPSWVPPDDVDQIVIGLSEDLSIDGRHRDISLICTPASVYSVGVWDDANSRYHPLDCTVNGSHNSSTTTLSVAVTDAGWAHDDGDYDLSVAGERMTVTAVGSVSSGLQSLTVTRSVNGVTKSHSDGEPVDLFVPAYLGL